ncbi:MAG TPA: hypothetical protein DDZ89_19510 [Clostridiales bacterium]|nr:hypothetical protein [Clostridiales bacterium]
MSRSLCILIAMDNETTRTLSCFFKSKGDVSVIGKAEDQKSLCNLIDSLNPDLVIMDLMLPQLNGIGVLMQYHGMENAPAFIAVSTQREAKTIDKAIKYGAKYVLVKPFEYEVLYGRLKLLTCRCPRYNGANEMTPVYESTKPVNYIFQKSEHDKQIEYEIIKSLYQIGIPSSIKGFNYIKDAVFMVLVDPECILAITKDIYPAIASKYFTTGMNVERAIRHAFTISWERGTPEGRAKIFGKGFGTRIKNAEAISMIASKVEFTLRQRKKRIELNKREHKDDSVEFMI